MARGVLLAGGMTQTVSEFSIRIEQVAGYEFLTHFDKEQFPELRTDEPAPLGQDTAPNPARILAAAVGNCLTASLFFCLSKAGVRPTGISADVKVEIVRNEKRRLRIGAVAVTLHPKLSENGAALAGCLEMFEDFCMVTQSVREGLEVKVDVVPEVSGQYASAPPAP